MEEVRRAAADFVELYNKQMVDREERIPEPATGQGGSLHEGGRMIQAAKLC